VAVPFVGLTGGMGAGKSTALAMLGELGAMTLSTDAVVHELYESDEVREALCARLGEDVVGADGAVDRALVASRVFADPAERAWLEGLLWPLVGARVLAAREEAERLAPVALVVETPLLFEAGMEGMYDATIAVLADDAVRAERTAGRGHAAAAEREGRQLSQEEKARRATFAVRNDGSREELLRQLSEVLAKLTS
jgi:dephospho-CoA kinase